jgi:hypothetical protein
MDVPLFEDLKAGLAEVDSFLAGRRNGYKLTVPAEIDAKDSGYRPSKCGKELPNPQRRARRILEAPCQV